ncbi:MAG: FGGY family carbohydrate kinase, partial [Elusimicrobiota bacterium]
MNNNEFIIVLDQGSSSSRAFAFGLNGRIKCSSQKQINAAYPKPGFVEYDANEILKTQIESFDEVLHALPSSSKISGLGIASQRSTIVLWDRTTGKPLGPALSWQDGRAFRELNETKISNEKIHKITGLYKTPYYSAPKILWCLKNYSDVRNAFKKGTLLAGPVATFILWHLSEGSIFTSDPTLAQRTLLFDIRTLKWHQSLLKLFKIPSKILPEIKPTFSAFGNIKRKGFEIPVYAVIGDQQAALLGLGIHGKKQACLNYGTGAFLLVNTGSVPVQIHGLLNSVGWTDGFNKNKTVYFSEGTVHSCGTMLEWLKTNFSFFNDISEIDRICKKSQHRIFALPAIGGIGSPYWDYKTPTSFTGMSSETDKNDLVRGTIEGICFMVSDIVEAMRKKRIKIKEIKVSGGVSKIDYLLQFQSDITGIQLKKTAHTEATAFGVAMSIAKILGTDSKKWRQDFKEQVFKPQMSPLQRKSLLNSWKNFLNLCQK